MSEETKPPHGFADKVIFGGIAAIMSALLLGTISLGAFLIGQVMTTNEKLVALEITVREVTRERAYQLEEIRERIDRLERIERQVEPRLRVPPDA